MSEADKVTILEMYDRGHSYSIIALRLGLSSWDVNQFILNNRKPRTREETKILRGQYASEHMGIASK